MTDPTDAIQRHPAVQRVRAALDAAGVQAQIVVLDDAVRTAAAAAAALGVQVGQIANSLVFAGVPADADPTQPPVPVLVLTSGAHRVDPQVTAQALGLARLGRADADFVRTHTGFAIGGVAPIGHLASTGPLRTGVDRHLDSYEVVWAAAGHPHSVFPTSFAELVRITGGRPIDVR